MFEHIHIDYVSVLDNQGEELKTYFFNYQFLNNVGSQVDISFNEFGRPEKVTLDTDDVLNWLRVFRSRQDPFFFLKATNKSTGTPLKINGADEYAMKCHTSRNSIDIINISASGKNQVFIFITFSKTKTEPTHELLCSLVCIRIKMSKGL